MHLNEALWAALKVLESVWAYAVFAISKNIFMQGLEANISCYWQNLDWIDLDQSQVSQKRAEQWNTKGK